MKSLKRILAVPIISYTVISLISALLIINYFASRDFNINVRAKSKALANTLCYMTSIADSQYLLRRFTNAFKSQHRLSLAVVMDDNKRIVASSRHLLFGKDFNLLKNEKTVTSVTKLNELKEFESFSEDSSYFLQIKSFKNYNNKLFPSGWVMIIFNTSDLGDQMRDIRNTLMASLGIIFIFVLFLTFFDINRYVLTPLKKVNNVVKSYGKESNINYQFNSHEIDAIYQSLIDMFYKIDINEKELNDLNEKLKKEVVNRRKLQEKAESANKAKSIFLANMSHELRTPLNAILGFTQIMERDLTIGKEQQEEISLIYRSGQHLLGLINDVLDIAKIEAGRVTLNEKSFDLYVFLKDISDQFHGRTVEKGLFFTMEKDTDLPHYIKSDESKLRQVLINLLGNALKFTETGGLTFRVRSGDAVDDMLYLHFEVEDTGIGIDSNHLEKIFDPFVQVSNNVNETGGTGLGLTISRQFVNLMGGSIEAENKINSGALFRFGLTVGRAEDSEIEDIPRSRRVIGLALGQPSFRILVVEDILESRKLLVKLLNTVGFEVQEASDGRQGVEVFNSWHPDLIWMDMRMPVLDGYEATKQIKKTEAGQKTIVIALTAHAFEEERQEILNIGCDDFISKPYVEEELFAAMEKHLGIEFIYEDQDVSLLDSPENPADILTPETLAELPKEIVSELLKVIARLDQKGCFSILEQLGMINKKVASSLRIMVENYQFEQLENILRQKRDLSK